MTLPPFGAYKYRVSKKLSFTKLSFWRSCFQMGRNTYDICDKSGKVQFGKTQFFETPCMYYEGKQDEREKKGFDLENRFHLSKQPLDVLNVTLS